MSDDIQLNVNADIAAAALEHFHDQKGGNRLVPQLDFDSKQSHLKKFTIHDDEAEASISFRPLQGDQSVMTINVNATDLWGWQLGVPGRSELGVTTYLGAETSPKCEQFCEDFVEHLHSIGFVISEAKTATIQKGQPGRPRNEANERARREIHLHGRDQNEVYPEWLEERSDASNLANPYQSFKKAIKKKPIDLEC